MSGWGRQRPADTAWPAGGLTFVPLDVASHLLEVMGLNIVAANKVLFLLLSGQAPTFKEALEWLNFSFTGYQTWD